MAEEMQVSSIFGVVEIASRIDALDQLNAAVYLLRGVSDSLLALSEQSHDYQDVMKMLSDVTIYESQIIDKVEMFFTGEPTTKEDADPCC